NNWNNWNNREMDIKTLLLKSLSLKRPISGCCRIYCGKSCFIIRYIVRGKILNVLNIKNAKKYETWSQRIRRQYNFYAKRTLRKRRLSNNIEKLTDSKEVQTSNQSQISENLRSTSTQSSIITVTTSAQQTIPTIRTSLTKIRECQMIKFQKSTKSCQTNLLTDSKGIQCKQYTIKNGTQTEKNDKDESTQVQVNLNIAPLLEKSTQTSNCTVSSANINDFDVIIYMLNEIGESVINQSQILNNTSEILKQVRQINQLKKSRNLRKSWRHVSAQTMEFKRPETTSTSTQTVAIFSKTRKLCFLKKQNRDQK
ncbi:hypothetical protein DOY81_004917, partial [Sarcophaga bullata]